MSTFFRLHQRLFQVLATEREPSTHTPLTEQEAREAITGHCEWAVAWRDPDPPNKPVTFREAFERLYKRGLDGKAVKEAKRENRA